MSLERTEGMEASWAEPFRALGYAALMEPRDPFIFEEFSFSPNRAYDHYLRMHKVFVGERGGEQLERIYEELRDEEMPRYLSAAGWAAAESALVRSSKPINERLALLEQGVACWQRALGRQRDWNEDAPDCLIEYSAPYRAALDIAVSPLLAHMIRGYVPKQACQSVFLECLNIAQSNAVRIRLMEKEGDMLGLADHLGFGYECNALLAFNRPINRRYSATRFAIPSMVRSDSGHYYDQQTHDLVIIEQDRGSIKRVTPVEIKAAASNHDRLRYKALIIRGKMHLSVPGKFKPGDTLAAITACYEGNASLEERKIAEGMSQQMHGMFGDYCAGPQLEDFASARSKTVFHDNTRVVANFPGLLAKVS